MSIITEILAIKNTVSKAEKWYNNGNVKSAENFIFALQIFLNQRHRPPYHFSSHSLFIGSEN